MAVFSKNRAWQAPDRNPGGRHLGDVMAEILRFEEAVGGRGEVRRNEAARRVRQNEHDSYSFWPEVSCGAWSINPVQADPRNSPQRVLSEMMLIIGGAGFLVLLATIFLAAPSP